VLDVTLVIPPLCTYWLSRPLALGGPLCDFQSKGHLVVYHGPGDNAFALTTVTDVKIASPLVNGVAAYGLRGSHPS